MAIKRLLGLGSTIYCNMIQCPYCGVELGENVNFCSLCGEPLWNKNKNNVAFIRKRTVQQNEQLLTDYQKLTGKQKRRLFWKISGMVLLSGILITLIIDLASSQSITWSRYPGTISMILFLNITLMVFYHKNNILWLSLSFISTSALLILLDLYAKGSGWGMQLGIPLLLAAYITVFALLKLINNTKQKGMNVIAYCLITAGVLSTCIDGIISIYTDGNISFGWSLIVLVSACIIAALLLYVHFRLKRATDLKRFFHI